MRLIQRLLFLAFTTLGYVGWSAPADACSCIQGPTVTLAWPKSGATEVPYDTAVVLSGVLTSSDLATIAFPEALAPQGDVKDAGFPSRGAPAIYLLSEDDQVIWLEEIRTSPGGPCIVSMFAKPTTPLAPNTHYQLIQTGSADSAEPIRGDFYTGETKVDSSAQEQAVSSLKWEALGASDDPTQMIMMYATEPAGGPPLFFNGAVNYRHDESGGEAVVHSFPTRFNPCPTVAVYGANGDLLTSKSMCEADRCVSREQAAPVIVSSCDSDASRLTYSAFEALPLGCGVAVEEDSAAPVAASAQPDGGQLNEVDPNHERSSRCSVSAVGTPGAGVGWLSGLFAVAWLSRRHRC